MTRHFISVGKTFIKPQKVDEKMFVKKSRPKRPDRLNKVPRLQVRPKSAPPPQQSAKEPAKPKPFIAYGCGSAEKETGVQKTFNVRASSAVSTVNLKKFANCVKKYLRCSKFATGADILWKVELTFYGK